MCTTKLCSKCNRELPLNSDYFFKKNYNKDGFNNKCKECEGYKFTKYNEIQESEMCCKRCERILPYTSEYFPTDKTTKTGLRNVCYECNGSKFGKRKPVSKRWTDNEDTLLKEVYSDNLNEDILHLFPNRTEKAIIDRARLLGVTKSDVAKQKRYKKQSAFMKENSSWINRVVSEDERKKLSEKMKNKWITDREIMLENARYERTDEIRKMISDKAKDRGSWKGENNPRHINPLVGSDNGNWKGGITPLLFWLRNQLGDWKQESMKFHNYTCVLSNKNFDEIHHLTSFKEIINITLTELDFSKTKTLEEYSDDELEILRNKVIEINDSFGLGVCLTKDVHKLFHDLYGYGDNSPEQFEEFSNRYRNGEFNELLNKVS